MAVNISCGHGRIEVVIQKREGVSGSSESLVAECHDSVDYCLRSKAALVVLLRSVDIQGVGIAVGGAFFWSIFYVVIIEGVNVNLVPVGISDAPWIAGIRSMPEVYRFLSQKSGVTVGEQRQWMLLEERRSEFYWKIWSKGRDEFVGLISLYDETDDWAHLGRFISFDSYAAVGAELTVLKFAFEQRQLNSVRCYVAKENRSVVSMHVRLGFSVIEDVYDESLSLEMLWLELKKEKFEEMDYSVVFGILESKIS